MKKTISAVSAGLVLALALSVPAPMAVFAEETSPSPVITSQPDKASNVIHEEQEALSGPGAQPIAEEPEEENTPERGESLGMFTTTGYCSCQKCSGGHSFTYSGTVPQAKHTISADLERFPIGTKLMIGDTVYTVEDKGSNVRGNVIDIYYDNHADAVSHGMKTQEVFRVAE